MPKKNNTNKQKNNKKIKQKKATALKLPKKVIEYLKKAGVPHDIIEHKTVYTAYDAAQTMGKKINEIAKSLLVKADKDYYVVILPADKNVDFDKLGKSIAKIKGKGVKTIKIPAEKIVQDLLRLKNETVGAFGQLHKLPVIADASFAKLKKAIFSSGGLGHSVEMKVADYLDLEKARVGSFGVKKPIKKTTKPHSTKAARGKQKNNKTINKK